MRQLTGGMNLRNMPREQAYFNDMTQFNNRDSYVPAVDRLAASGCDTVGIDNRSTLPVRGP